MTDEYRAYNIDDGGETDNSAMYVIPPGSLGPGLVNLSDSAGTGPAGIMSRNFDTIMMDSLDGYPGELPAELGPWLVYIMDSGYCLGVVPRVMYKPGEDNSGWVSATPVRTVLRSPWERLDGWIVTDAPFSGVTVAAEEVDYEFEGGSGDDDGSGYDPSDEEGDDPNYGSASLYDDED